MKKILPMVFLLVFIAMPVQASEITGTLNTDGGVIPSAPSGLNTSSPAKGDTSITINWNAVAFVGGYNLYRIKSGSSAVFVASTTNLTYTDAQLLDGNYSYQVESYLGTLTSEKSTPTVPVTIEPATQNGGNSGGGGGGSYVPPPATSTQADFNGDGVVNIFDFNILMAHWGTTSGATKATGDANGDGKVNIIDFTLLMANWTH